MVALYQSFSATQKVYQDHAKAVLALSREYHETRLREKFPGVPVEVRSTIKILDSRQSPQSLDTFLATLDGLMLDRIYFDPYTGEYALTVTTS